MTPLRSVQNRAATAGTMRSATIRTSPTMRRPTTVTPMTSAISARSTARTGTPLARAKPASKATSVSGRRRRTSASVTSAAPPAMVSASARSIPAVEPSRKLSSPA